MTKTKLQNGDTMLFIGDSITDCGRRDDRGKPLGLGYVQMFADLITIREPEKSIRVINTGIGGNTVEDLRSRWWDDMLSFKPDWLSVKIGMNDCNRHLCSDKETLQSPRAFERICDQILTETKRRLPACNILLIDPFFMSRDDVADSYRAKVVKTLPTYIATVHKMSAKYKTRLVRTHELFQKQLKHHTLESFGIEPVHPNSAGHLLIAEAVCEALSK
jgi:lysophospholipase L1-like esterase